MWISYIVLVYNINTYWSHFILGGLNYYVLTFKLIIWYNAFIVYIHVFTLCFYLKKYLYVVTSVINFCNYIYNYTVDQYLTPTHTTKPVPNLIHIPPQ